MEKITEKILLEKGSPKANTLKNITSLNLSRMGLKNPDLPVALLNKLSSLEELDLSGNMLQKLPAKLSLPRLRLLNFSNNDMEDVTSLEALASLEELRLDDNLYLTVSDEHKVMFLLPKLKILNGKDISATANHIRYVNSEILRKRVIAVWEKNFSLPDPPISQSLNELEKKFVNASCSQVKYGPSSLNDYTKWRVEMIAKEYLKSLTNPEQEEDMTVETPVKENESPRKRKSQESDRNRSSVTPQKRRTIKQTAAPEASPRKSSRITDVVSIEASPRKSSRLQGTPQKPDSSPKGVKMNTPEVNPRKSSRMQTPRKRRRKWNKRP
ncbi:Leucine-rich repeat and WD repeat-containing protein 1 [Bagarius yarrelli]|uniref:Leucine-rich repeat and WD repeat-containing protein 1 n=1 Tax=Bagarius yarrelli TaxID=175774 RepID=A0A556UY03_BAGYA|nr:Leucine-rich repeat and WD repeat-containing protein 1 [Bagarius yarrelli]